MPASGFASRAILATVMLALLGASLSPCPQPAPARDHSHADCHRPAAERFLDAPCPCGCSDGAPASATARLGDALLGSAVALDAAQASAAPAAPAPTAPPAPLREIDHVPRIA